MDYDSCQRCETVRESDSDDNYEDGTAFAPVKDRESNYTISWVCGECFAELMEIQNDGS